MARGPGYLRNSSAILVSEIFRGHLSLSLTNPVGIFGEDLNGSILSGCSHLGIPSGTTLGWPPPSPNR